MMTKPDLLITWIKHADYPLFRQWLRTHRAFFGKVIIYWSDHFRHIYVDEFIQKDLADLDILFLPHQEYRYGVEDWRNVSTNRMLAHSTAEWICSVEQDFFAADWQSLLSTVMALSETHDLIGYRGHQGQEDHQRPYLQGEYVHPAFWFMKREALEKTAKNFSADTTQGCDHFGLITRDAQRLHIPIAYIQDHGFSEFVDAFHQGGVNVNYLESGTPNLTFHRPNYFFVYNYFSMKVPTQDPAFFALCQSVDQKMRNQGYANPEVSPYRKFYEFL